MFLDIGRREGGFDPGFEIEDMRTTHEAEYKVSDEIKTEQEQVAQGAEFESRRVAKEFQALLATGNLSNSIESQIKADRLITEMKRLDAEQADQMQTELDQALEGGTEKVA
jgi:hypothetical protein